MVVAYLLGRKMPEEIRQIAVRLPAKLVRAARFDALAREVPMTAWWKEAAERLLAERVRQQATDAKA